MAVMERQVVASTAKPIKADSNSAGFSQAKVSSYLSMMSFSKNSFVSEILLSQVMLRASPNWPFSEHCVSKNL